MLNTAQNREAELKLEAYRAATEVCCNAWEMSEKTPNVGDVKAEAERLWAWMIEEKKT